MLLGIKTGGPEAKASVPRSDSRDQARKLIDFARRNADDPVVLMAYGSALDLLSRQYEAAREEMEAILETMIDRWAGSEEIKAVFPRIKLHGVYCSNYESLLRNVGKNSASREAAAHAKYQLAELLNRFSRVRRIDAESPESHRKLVKILGEEQLQKVLARNPGELDEEWRRLAADVIDNYSGVNWWPSGGVAEKARGNRPLKTFAIEMLARDNDVAVGRKAPNIIGINIRTGAPLELSDFKGKIVVVVFWASWCGPCMSMIPEERELVEKFKDKPFALLGVNLDQERGKALEVIEREEMTWPSWSDADASIQESLHVKGQGIPRTFVIDHEGVIRCKDQRGRELETSIAKLLSAVPVPHYGVLTD